MRPHVKAKSIAKNKTQHSLALSVKRRSGFAARYSAIKRWCSASGREFNLTLAEYSALAVMPCHYCRGTLPQYGSGLDRADNDQGYTPENVVPCCSVCNRVKMHVFTEAEMMRLGALVREIMAERKGSTQ